MKDNWVEDLPIRPLSDIISSVIRDSSKFGNLPGEDVTFPTYYEGLLQRIKRTNVEILDAKNRDDVAAAETRLKMFKDEIEKINVSVRRVAIEGLLRTVYACVGYLTGRMVVVPCRAWAGHLDWEQETLSFEGRTYTRLRTIASSDLTQEQKDTIRRYLNEEEDNLETGKAVGRPNLIKYVRAEFKRRAASHLVLSPFKAEAEWLAAWFSQQHSDKESLEVKTIMNKLADDYKAYEEETKKRPKI